MTTKRKVLTSFLKETDDEILVNGRIILSAMTNNPNFETPMPPLAEIALGLEEYQNALIKARQTQSLQDVEAKRTAKTQLQNLLSKLANYVNLIADGDVVKLDSSGFELNKEHHAIGMLEAPQTINLNSVHEGQVEIKIGKVEGASSYLVLYRVVGEENWHNELLRKTNGTIKNLRSVAKYEFKVAATSSTSSMLNEYNYSQIVTIVVQ